MAVARMVRPMRTQAIAIAGDHIANECMEDIAAFLGERDAFDLALSRRIEKTELDRCGVRGKDGNVGTARSKRQTERLGTAGADATHPFNPWLARSDRDT